MILTLLIKPALFILLLFAHCSDCDAHEDHSHQETCSLYGYDQIRDLNIVSDGESSSLVDTLDRTMTLSGRESLVYHLTNVPSENGIVQERALLLMKLAQNPDSLIRLRRILKNIQSCEASLDAVRRPLDPVAGYTIRNFYYSSSWMQSCNNSATALDALSALKYFGLFGPLFEHLILHFALDNIASFFVKKTIGVCDHENHTHHGSHSHDGHVCVSHLQAPSGASSFVQYGIHAIKGIHIAAHIGGLKEMWEQLSLERSVLAQLYFQNAQVQRMLLQVDELLSEAEDLGYRSDLFGITSEQYDEIYSMMRTDKRMKRFLAEKRYRKSLSPGFFSRSGKILAHQHMLRGYTDIFDNLVTLIGDIDALTSMAQWYRESNENHKPVCVVDFVSGTSPVIHSECLWNTMIEKPDVVGNTIALDKDLGSAIIITGPNKSGKSCVLKSIGHAVIMGQTYGIAPAQHMTLTPFARLMTHIVVVDDSTHDKSLMVAEMVRAEETLETARLMQAKAPVLVLIDDSLFKGTSYLKGQELACAYAKSLLDIPTACCIFVTHYPQLTELEKEYPNRLDNYCIETVIKDDRLQSTYLLKKGIAQFDQVFDIVKENCSFA